jgi:multiple sugar transport system substrate-binding protein
MPSTTPSPRRRRTGPAIAASAAAAALVLTGCAGGSGADGGSADGAIDGSITLQTWSLTPTYQEYLDGVIADFEAANPGSSVELVDQPGEGYSEKVLSQASSNTLPDVINLPPDIALPLAERGFLYDISASDDSLDDTFVAGALDAYEYTGVDGVYGYPWYLNTDVNYWNTAQMDRCGLDSTAVPATTDDLFEQAETMHATCPDEYLMSRKPGLSDFSLTGASILDEDGSAFTFADDEDVIALIDRYADAYQKGYLPPSVLSSDYLGNSTLFTQAKVAWTTGGASSLADFVKNNPSLEGGVAVSEALDTPPLYVQGLSVSAKSPELATANAFAAFMTNEENQNAFGHIVNVFPSTTASASDPYFSEDDGTTGGKARSLAFASLEQAENLVPVEANAAMTTFLDQQIALAMKGDVTGAEALQTAQAKMNQLLAQG